MLRVSADRSKERKNQSSRYSNVARLFLDRSKGTCLVDMMQRKHNFLASSGDTQATEALESSARSHRNRSSSKGHSLCRHRACHYRMQVHTTPEMRTLRD